jgi:hypothetical protein
MRASSLPLAALFGVRIVEDFAVTPTPPSPIEGEDYERGVTPLDPPLRGESRLRSAGINRL